MDKRSFLAIGVTFAILLIWQMFYVMPRQKEAARRNEIQQRELAVADSLDEVDSGLDNARNIGEEENQDSPPASGNYEDRVDRNGGTTETWQAEGGFFSAAGDLTPRQFTIENEKMKVVLSSRGARIESIRLPGFRRKNGEEVELIPADRGGGMALSLEHEGIWKSLSEMGFSVSINGAEVMDGEQIVLSEQLERADVVFVRAGVAGERVEKKYSFSRDGFEVGLKVSITREGELKESTSWALSWDAGIELNEKNRKDEIRQLASMGMVGEDFNKESSGKFGKTDRKEQAGTIVWAGARSKYFLAAVVAEDQKSGTLALLGDKEQNRAGYALEYPFRGDPRRLDDSFICYFGPLDMEGLKVYGVGLEKSIEMGKLRFFSVFVLRLMLWMKKFIPNYGLIIIILSILTKVLFYRLTHKSFKSMKDMQKLQPKLKALQEKYKDDKEKLNKETMKMYKEGGVNPLGGCLPLLFQMPVFIALFNVLRNTIELRDAPLGLWINDLSTPDVLFNFGVNLPLLGSEFHLLPILMGVAMVVQTKLGGTPEGSTGPASQTKMMQTMMPIVFTFIFYGMPSGLVLYWLINNILSIIQQYFVHKAIDAEEAAAEGAATNNEK